MQAHQRDWLTDGSPLKVCVIHADTIANHLLREVS